MSFGFPPHYEETRHYDMEAAQLADAVRATLEKFGWSYKAESNNEISAHSPLSGYSWGEDLRINILLTGDLRIESRCSGGFNMFQIVDWGKNKRNVQSIFAAVEQMIGYGRIPPEQHQAPA
jgi:hypothetical protein